MYNRRSFLVGAGSVALAQILSGCNSQKEAFRVLVLENSIPSQLIGAFRSEFSDSSIFKPKPQLDTLLESLETWQEKDSSKKTENNWLPWLNQKPSPVANLVTLGDAWLEKAIDEKLISPLDVNQLKQWQQLPALWQEIVQRNQQGIVDKNGEIWGAPYRWGATTIVYQKNEFKKLDWTPTDWKDLWREEIKGRISLLDEPREVIGLTLKKLGYSYNTEDLQKIANLKSELAALNQQVKFYSSDRYLEPLILGDTWLAVGWSHEIIPLLSRYQELEAVIPQSGTALWTDVWVKPASADSDKLVPKWIDFCWNTKSVQQISLYTNAASPLIFNKPLKTLSKASQDNPLLLIDRAILNHSEFIKPLGDSSLKQYKKLWQEMRSPIS